MSNDRPYSRRALARLALSLHAAQLADRIGKLVSAADDSWSRSGELADEARGLVTAVEELLQRAIVVERSRGASWAQLGEVLDMSKQGAQQKYGEGADEWTDLLDNAMEPSGSFIGLRVLPGEGPDSPEQHAKRLDAWVLRRTEKVGRSARDKGPVSGYLERSSDIEQTTLLTRLAHRMLTVKDPAKLREFLACKAALLTRVAEQNPEDIEAVENAQNARRERAMLSKQWATTKANKARRKPN